MATSAIQVTGFRPVGASRRPEASGPRRPAAKVATSAFWRPPLSNPNVQPTPAGAVGTARSRQSIRSAATGPSSASTADGAAPPVDIFVDNDSDPMYTKVTLQAPNRPGLLTALTSTFRDLNLDVAKAVVDKGKDGKVEDVFYVTDLGGDKVTDAQDVSNLKICLAAVFSASGTSGKTPKKRPDSTAVTGDSKKELLYTLMDTYIRNDVLSIQESIVNHVEYTLARSRYKFDDFEAYQATAYSLRDRLIESWNDTQEYFKEQDPKRVYYLSMEFLMGRSMNNALYNLEVKDQYTEALQEMGYSLETIMEKERDAALGNGGLGRLAACFLDSMATLNLPAWGYGIRYQYGMFRQTIKDGFQHEQPDYWLNFGNPWEIERPQVSYDIKFYGHVSVGEDNQRQVFKWHPGEAVSAVAYDNPIPGFATNNTINLRLWSAKPAREFDLEAFNTGDYIQAILAKQRAETLSSVLYPDDRTYEGKELRLKQQHFFTSASIQDVVRRYKETHDNWDSFGEQVAFQLNDTHPTIGVAELMRLLMDENSLGWTKSWELTTKVFSFTNHTVLPEALEKWPVTLVEKLLPRHMQIIYDINWRFIQTLRNKYGDDYERIGKMSIIEELPDGQKFIRMAYMALVASHTVNGVAAIHSDIIKKETFKEFYDLWPEKFQNKTNGVTQRRWLAFCNPGLRKIISDKLGNEEWITDLEMLQDLVQHADDKAFQDKWWDVKQQNKARLAAKVKELTGVEVNSEALFDIQVKRIHEYKRQFMNVLGIIHRYKNIKAMSPDERSKVQPRVCVIGGKAAPGYEMAKRIIKLISAVADKINGDPDVGDLLKLVFIPDYNVSLAEVIVPASDVSQHISTAGTEASGTSNMKFVMNGGLIIGTLDGANIEIAEEAGRDNIFIFGHLEDEVTKLRKERATFKPDPRFTEVLNMIKDGYFGFEDYLAPLVESVTGDVGGDFYLLANDFPMYLEAQEKADACYADKAKWTRMSIMNTASTGKFSSDRTIREYAEEIWGLEPCPVPAP